MKKTTLCLIILIISFLTCYALDEEWKVKKSTHFIVYYKGDLDYFTDKVVDRAEALYEEITGYLGFRRENFWLWENRAKIYIHENAKEYQAVTNQPSCL
jgi:hypothetical protein